MSHVCEMHSWETRLKMTQENMSGHVKCWSQGAAELPACRYFSHLVTLTLRTKHSPKISPGGFKKNIEKHHST